MDNIALAKELGLKKFPAETTTFSREICEHCFFAALKAGIPEKRSYLLEQDFNLPNNLWPHFFDLYWKTGHCLCVCNRFPPSIEGELPISCKYILEQILALE